MKISTSWNGKGIFYISQRKISIFQTYKDNFEVKFHKNFNLHQDQGLNRSIFFFFSNKKENSNIEMIKIGGK